MASKVYQAPNKGDKMKPEANPTQTAKVPGIRILNKPLHTRTDDDGLNKLALEPSEATCPIVRETL